VEFTVEANPASLTDAKAGFLRDHGVTRISMGAQSFHKHELHVLDRIHRPEDVAASAEIVRRAGFAHFNLDLIFGIPGQTRGSWEESLRRAIDLGPDHLACYGLTYEPDTPLRERRDAGLLRQVDDDWEAELYLSAIDTLADAGFAQYEISNFARPGGRSLHNLRYWKNLPGIGIGPSAASYLGGRRWRNVPDLARYVACVRSGDDPAIESETLSALERAGETAMLQLRLVEGIRCRAFATATGFDPHLLFADQIERYTGQGLLDADEERIALTRAGRLLGDAVIAEFLSPAEPQPA
jgi:oxygen-independent coproporphyrinogen-3 oxidase